MTVDHSISIINTVALNEFYLNFPGLVKADVSNHTPIVLLLVVLYLAINPSRVK